ncbi:hypothetical protein [Dysgonomonas termitidis]|uniref:Uncharacterized protein n=1 Tax=Dysgonomonas termitidis TaxID=1516126 RepID=A0ABV9L1W1_9BACT
METIRLDNITEYRPVIRDFNSLADMIISKMDGNYSGYKTFEFECGNGIKIQVEADYKGFNTRVIALKQIYIMSEDLEAFAEYEDCLKELLTDRISDLNYNAEQGYYSSNQINN